MPGSRDHDADHNAISRTLDEWDFDLDARVDILRDTLILHLGAFHGWTVAKRGGISALRRCLWSTIVHINSPTCSPSKVSSIGRSLREFDKTEKELP